jgi:predicted nuclease of predicted toxin-antitoxin system
VLEAANREEALLLTADKDFGELVFRQRRITPGVVLIRLAGLSPIRKAGVVASAINQHSAELQHAFAVVMPGSVRIRRLAR